MNTIEDRNNGQAVAKQNGQASASRFHVNYWKDRLYQKTFTRDGKTHTVPGWSVRLQHDGQRGAFSLGSANATAAASKAKEIALFLEANGWEATMAKFKPDSLPKLKAGTVGEAIAAAKELSTTRPQSFAQAALRLRQLAGEMGKVKVPANRTAYFTEEFREWREKIDAVPLTLFSAENVRMWRARRIAARAENPIEKRAATISADSTIRMARAIFSKRILAAGLGSKVELPTPLPFVGVTTGDSTKRFKEKIDAAKLFASARADLEKTHVEQFRAFALCILAGLRRSEADRLAWSQVDLANATISIERTEYFEPKSEESIREINLAPAIVDILRRAKSDTPDPIFVLKGGEHRLQLRAATYYRADVAPHRTWRGLSAWLSNHGIRDGKPIHVLRKLAGSLVFAEHGLEQARDFLGHASVVTTSASYVANVRKVTVSIAEPDDDLAVERKKAKRGGATL